MLKGTKAMLDGTRAMRDDRNARLQDRDAPFDGPRDMFARIVWLTDHAVAPIAYAVGRSSSA